MGSLRISASIHARVTRNNSADDDQDDIQWDELLSRVRDVIKDFDDIGAWLDEGN